MVDLPFDQPVSRWRPIFPSAVSGETRRVSIVPDQPPTYSPAPRKYWTAPVAEVEIKGPPAPINPIGLSLVTAILPIVATFIGLGLGFLVFAGSNLTFFWFSGPMLLVSIILAIYNYIHERRRYHREVKQRNLYYQEYLHEKKAQLENLRVQQLLASVIANPDLKECLHRAELQDEEGRLWERNPKDEDFLHLRVGTGLGPATFRVKPPDLFTGSPVDELGLQAINLAKQYSNTDSVAVLLPLTQLGSVGLVGEWEFLRDAARSIIIQAATHHAPDQVKIVLVYSEHEQSYWAWAR